MMHSQGATQKKYAPAYNTKTMPLAHIYKQGGA